tara:strand:- start:413 stop:1024 length:612 start_codon:yes stop_codon:yes gene_type:complete
MQKTRCIYLFFFILTTLTNCLTYAKARTRDFLDIASFTIGPSTGATVKTGPLILGLEYTNGGLGLRGGFFGGFPQQRPDLPSGTLFYDFPGSQFREIGDQLIGSRGSTYCFLRTRGKYYRPGHWPLYRYGSVAVSAGLLFGARVEINFYEIFDFFAGLVGFDPLSDDEWAKPAGLFNIPSATQFCEDYRKHWPERPNPHFKPL